jgi:hypothetical protein
MPHMIAGELVLYVVKQVERGGKWADKLLKSFVWED